MEAENTVVHADGCSTNLGIIGAVCNCGAEAQAEISFKVGEQEEYKKWINAFMEVGIMIAGADKVGIAIDETRRAGIKEMAEWILSDDSMPLQDEYKYPPKTVAQVKAKLKEWGIDETSKR